MECSNGIAFGMAFAPYIDATSIALLALQGHKNNAVNGSLSWLSARLGDCPSPYSLGFPITEVLVAEGLRVFGVDAASSFVQAFRRNLPNIPVACEAVQDSTFFDRTFDGVLAWGLMFLLSPDDQRRLIQRTADILVPGGRILFTSPAEPLVWNDAMTGLESRSLGAEEYQRQLSLVGLSIASEYEDEGENHYFDALKDRHYAILADGEGVTSA
jgi:SAM-dependent methyltransferase